MDAIGEPRGTGEPVADEGDPTLAGEIALRVRPPLSPVGLAAVPLEGGENGITPVRG